MKVQRDVFRPIYPTPAGLITSALPEGRPNIITLGEVYMLSLTPLVLGISIRPSRLSHEIISATGEYVVNIPTAAMTDAVDLCGMVSGRDVDKFAATGLTPSPASVVKAPLIAECPLSIECKVLQIMPFGSHHVFAGEAVATHVDEAILDERGQIDPVIAQGIAFVARGYFAVGDLVAPA